MKGAGFNAMGYSNPRYDELIVEANLELEPEARKALLVEASNITNDDAASLRALVSRWTHRLQRARCQLRADRKWRPHLVNALRCRSGLNPNSRSARRSGAWHFVLSNDFFVRSDVTVVPS